MKRLQVVLWALVAIVSAGLLLTYVTRSEPEQNAATAYGAPFSATLVSTDVVRPITRDDILGRPHVMFFGFTHCPDVCPTTLYETSQWLDALGDPADGLDAYFVTVDPERDTAQVMQDYLQPLDSRIRAITGNESEIADLIEGWNVYSKKVPMEGGGYNVDHTASTFLMRADGTLQGTIAYRENMDVAVQKLERLISN